MSVSWLPGALPEWAVWAGEPAQAWNIRISEDVLLVDSQTWDACGATTTLTTRPQRSVACAVAESALLRSELIARLGEQHAVSAASAGTHPWSDAVAALRIHVAVTDGDCAVRALDGLRPHLPLLLGLAANSPFWRSHDTGLASARAALRATLPHTGLPRRFGSFKAYVDVVQTLIDVHALPDHAAVRWDARVCPELGALEVSVMDAQARIGDVAALSALVQCLVRLFAEGDAPEPTTIPEILAENRSAAVRDGIGAQLIDPEGEFSRPAADELAALVEACAPAALELDCARELAYTPRAACDPGYARQRELGSSDGLAALVAELSQEFGERRTEAVSAR